PGYRLGRIRAADARGPRRREASLRQSLTFRRLDAEAGRDSTDALRKARRATRTRSVGPGLSADIETRRGAAPFASKWGVSPFLQIELKLARTPSTTNCTAHEPTHTHN